MVCGKVRREPDEIGPAAIITSQEQMQMKQCQGSVGNPEWSVVDRSGRIKPNHPAIITNLSARRYPRFGDGAL